MMTQKFKTPEEMLMEHINNTSRKKYNDDLDAIYKSALNKKQTSGTIDSSKSKKDKKQTKKSDMKMENPYGMPNPNPQNTEDYNMTKSEKQRTYTQKDIDKANGPRVASAYNDNRYYNKQDLGKVAEDKELTEDLQAQMLELNKKRSEILKDGTAQEFKDVEEKLRGIQKTLEARGTDSSTLEDTLNDHGKNTDSSEVKGDDIDEAAENELADQLERERNKDAGKEVDDIDTLGDEELADRFEREKGKATKEGAEGSNPETVTVANEAEAQQEKIEKLKNALDSARGNYTKLQYKSEGMLNKIKGMLGNVNTSEDQDVAGRQEVYKNALVKYRDARIAEAKGLSGEEQEKIIAELEAFDANEHINLYDARVDAKAETFPGKLGEMTNKLVQGYKKLPTSLKIGLSGALFAAGLATGTGVAAGFIGAATIGKRALGASAMGMGVTGWREAKAQAAEQEKIRINLEELQHGLSMEERIAQLSGYDEASFSKLDSAFKGKVAGRSRRVMLGLATTAAAMSVGEVAKLFGGAEDAGVPTPDSAATVADVDKDAVLESKPTENMMRAAAGGVNEGVGTPWLEEELAAAKELPATDRDKMEEYLMKLNQGEAIQSGTVNEELLKQQAQEAFAQYNLTGEVPEMPGVTETVEGGVDVDVAMEQSDVSGVADNPLTQGFNDIKMNADNIGTLPVKGSGIEGALAKFLIDNKDKLTEGNMGWNPEEYEKVSDWAGARAHIIFEEIKQPDIDYDKVPSGTTLNLNLSNPADIKLDKIDFNGGKHIIPEGVKVENPLAMGISGEVSHFEGMTESEVLKELGGNREFKVAVAEQMKETFGASDIANTLRNVAPSDMNFYLSEENIGVEKDTVVGLRDRAIAAFGESGNPRPGARVDEYFIRIFAKAVHEGKVKEVFPSADFSV